MTDIWYLIILHPGTPPYDVWPVGDGSDMDLQSQYIQAARDLLGYPTDEIFPPGWDCSVSTGMPHPSLLAQATLHDGPPELP